MEKTINSEDTKWLQNGTQSAKNDTTFNSNSNSNNNTELIEREPIENTPFHVVGNKDTGYMLTLGRYKISEIKATKGEAYELLYTEQWNIMVRLVTTLHEAILTEIKNTPINQPEK